MINFGKSKNSVRLDNFNNGLNGTFFPICPTTNVRDKLMFTFGYRFANDYFLQGKHSKF